MVNLVHSDRIVSVGWLFPERIHGNRLCIDQTDPSTITGSANIRYLEDNDVPIRIDGDQAYLFADDELFPGQAEALRIAVMILDDYLILCEYTYAEVEAEQRQAALEDYLFRGYYTTELRGALDDVLQHGIDLYLDHDDYSFRFTGTLPTLDYSQNAADFIWRNFHIRIVPGEESSQLADMLIGFYRGADLPLA